MTRNEMVEGLELALNYLNRPLEAEEGYDANADAALRAAIALLTPPTTEEIEAAREWVHSMGARSKYAVPVDTLYFALDALAREPGLHAEIECLSRGLCASTDGCVEYQRAIAALEARLARVREVAGALLDALDRCQQPYEHEVRRKELRAALAADAGPPVGLIRCAECNGTADAPRGLCGGVLHPRGADAGPASGEPSAMQQNEEDERCEVEAEDWNRMVRRMEVAEARLARVREYLSRVDDPRGPYARLCQDLRAALAADAGPPVGLIRCAECNGTADAPRGLCGGVLHPRGADAGPASEVRLPPIPIDLIRKAREWAFSDALRSLMPMDVRMAMAQVLADCLDARRESDAGPVSVEPK